LIYHLHPISDDDSDGNWIICKIRDCRGHLSRPCPLGTAEYEEVENEAPLAERGIGDCPLYFGHEDRMLSATYWDWEQRRCRCDGIECVSDLPQNRCDGIHHAIASGSAAVDTE